MTGSPSWLTFGANHRLQILVIEPLFEESNRCRKLIADFMRALDARATGSALVSLPGQGESEELLAEVRLADWQAAIANTPGDGIAAFRGGALLDCAGPSRPVWRFAPESGARVIRDLRRAGLASENPLAFAGHPLSEPLATALEATVPETPAMLRTLRLESDPLEADRYLAGSPLWRRAEPGSDTELANALAADCADWIRRCAA